ncbi:PqqD family peptide modification chaperone [Microtetraspora malaysiensis]|uniref:PqqD family peptide modification chaperone n=1 Tax=Microtetraspora malaysiensis TaxID=161358 RepID=UPI00082E2562|nr:PqqD family peptide modification chaperone [Microtetraspora malaysiensis]
MTSADLSFLSVVADGPDDYVIGNGETFVNVPAVAAAVIELMDGTRTADDVRARVRESHDIDVDVADFVQDLERLGLLTPPRRPPNVWDRIRPGLVRPLFSRAADAVVLVVFCCAVAAIVTRPEILPTYAGLVWADSLAFTVAFAAGSWLLVFVHELSHIFAARSLGVRAELSLGTRMQFLVVQTKVTGIWQTPRSARYRVHLAGMRTDLFLFSAGACTLLFVDSGAIRLVMLICLSQIVWQFLFFMRTDVYYAYANLTGEKNLMEDAQSYLRAVIGRRSAPDASRGVRRYAWFLVVGRVLGLAFFAGYTIPVTVAACRGALDELAASPGSLGPLATLMIIALGWVLYLYVFARRGVRAARARRSADAG